MSAVRARGLVAQVHDTLREEIVAGGYAPDAPLNITELAKRFGVSPTPVREALARLAAAGQLQFVENIGYRTPALPTGRDYTDWAIARLVIESNALIYILGPIDQRLVDEAEVINEHIRATDFGSDPEGVRAYSEANWAFHAHIIALARNPLLDEAHERLYRAPQFSRIFLGHGIPDKSRVVTEHARVLKRLRRGDRAGAAAALRHHIVDSLERDARLAQAVVSLKRLVRDAG